MLQIVLIILQALLFHSEQFYYLQKVESYILASDELFPQQFHFQLYYVNHLNCIEYHQLLVLLVLGHFRIQRKHQQELFDHYLILLPSD